MAELGEQAPAYHRQVGEAVAAAGVDVLVGVGPLARGFVDGAVGVSARWFAHADEAGDAVAELVRPGDVVLVKGSRAVGLEAVVAKLTA
jgi:UDP-N-acetylmuramoyl-tripeptide--D-alanyl-D-alanine ligase